MAEILEGEERLYAERFHLRGIPEVGTMVTIEVASSEAGRNEYERNHQGRRIRYYLPKGFQTMERGSHELGIRQVWLRFIRASIHSSMTGSILRRLRSLRGDFDANIYTDEELLTTSAIAAKEKIRMVYWLGRALPKSVKNKTLHDGKKYNVTFTILYSI